ncbi:MAG: helix-turn-helix domain-containing protein [Alphaproteobacteria bacterium]|nr:helix-turn-helix domain-containing protein [Alphaproteobacteria bacterium]
MLDSKQATNRRMTIGDRIKQARESAGLNQAQLAKLCRVSAQAVSQWESGATSPKGENIGHLIRALKVRAEWLTLGIGPRDPDPNNGDDATKTYALRVTYVLMTTLSRFENGLRFDIEPDQIRDFSMALLEHLPSADDGPDGLDAFQDFLESEGVTPLNAEPLSEADMVEIIRTASSHLQSQGKQLPPEKFSEMCGVLFKYAAAVESNARDEMIQRTLRLIS